MNQEPAFPCDVMLGDRTVRGAGMTLRDYFAAKALAGMLADLPKTCYGLDWKKTTAQKAYELADAMLKAREAS